MAMKRKIETCNYAYEVTALLVHKMKKDPRYSKYEIVAYPPMGLEAACSIAVKDNEKCIGFLTIVDDNETGKFRYRTNRVLKTYPKGSIGDINGFNIVKRPLPCDIEEVFNLIMK